MGLGVKKIGKLPRAFVAHISSLRRTTLKCTRKSPKKTPKPTWALLLFLTLPFLAAAQQMQNTVAAQPTVNIAAVIKPRHIQFGEKARLELTISGNTHIQHIKTPKFNFLPAFLAVPIHSQTIPQLEADKIAVSMAWIYELIPQAVGDFALSDIRFAYQDNLYFANPGSIRVTGADTYHEASTGGVHRIEVQVDTEKPYLNAPFNYTFRYLYTTVLPTRDTLTPRLPTFHNCSLGKSQKPPLYTRNVRGKTFWVNEQTHTLYPQKTGLINLQPAELLLPLPQAHKILKTEPLTLNVQPIPETGRPANFNGAIGEYQISAQLERGRIEIGHALTLTVHIAGRGNMQTVTPPELPTLPGINVSGPNSQTADTSDLTPTSRNYVYTLTPKRIGTLRIPPILYSYFDPNRATYATTQTAEIPLSVYTDPTRVDPNTIENDGRAWKVWIVILIASALLIALLVGFLRYRSNLKIFSRRVASHLIGKTPSDPDKTTEMETDTPAAQAQQTIAALASTNTTTREAAAFTHTLTQTLYRYLESTLPLSQPNIETLQQIGTHAHVANDVLEELVDLLKKCDYYRFAPVPLSNYERDTLITRAQAIIDHIENRQNAHSK